MIDHRSMDVELVWRTSGFAQALATCAAVALAVAVLAAQWQLIAFAASALGLLASLRW